MNEKITIQGKYCGYLNTGNGGYVCGMAAQHIEGAAEVTLWNPPPVDVPLDVERNDGSILLKDGHVVVAEARSSCVDLDIPAPPTYEQAVEASKLSIALVDNPPSPDCFVCGCNRTGDDGLRVFAGPVSGHDIVAAPWIPDLSLADELGRIRDVFLWSVLDCPGAYSFFDEQIPIIVLGRLVACVKNNVRPGERCVVIGWKIGTERQKLFSGSALFSEDGELCGMSKATWLPMKGA